jgi:hypothetical protein
MAQCAAPAQRQCPVCHAILADVAESSIATAISESCLTRLCGIDNLLTSLCSLNTVWHTGYIREILERGVRFLHAAILSRGAVMITPAPSHPYKHHRFPGEIISYGVWLYDRFSLSHSDVEELLFARGVIALYEAIRTWCRKFGQAYTNILRRRRPRPGDKWHLDEVFITLNARRTYSNVQGQENLEALLCYVLRRYDITLTRCLGAL